MAKMIISSKIRKLDEFRNVEEIFGNGYLRKIDKYFVIERKNRAYLVNTFFMKNSLEVFERKSLQLLELFEGPRSFIVFCDALRSRFRLNFKSPRKADLDRIRGLMDFVCQLVEKRFLVHDTFNEYTQLTKYRKKALSYDFHPSAIYIIPTLECNFRCKGCFIYAGDWGKKRTSIMKSRTFDHQLDFILNFIPHLKKRKNKKAVVNIIFYGGEPLLNKPLVEHAARRLRDLQEMLELDKSFFSLNIVTNGSLLDEHAADMLKTYDIIPGISLDGFGHSHNLQRAFKDGGGTFDEVINAIRILQKKNIDFGISWTIGPDNIDRVPKDLEWMSKTLGKRNVFFNFMHGTKPNEAPFKKMGEKKLFRKMHAIYDKVRELGIVEGRLERYMKFAQKGEKPYWFYCSALGSGQFVLRPDGKIGICHAGMMHDDHEYQHPEEMGDIYTDPIYRKWMNRTPLMKKACYLHCNHFTFCPGGCEYRLEQVVGTRETTLDEICMIERFLIERAIIEILER